MKRLLTLFFTLLFSISFGQNNLNCEITTEWEYLQNSICAGDSIGVFSHMHDSYYFEFLEGSYDTIILNNTQSIQGCLDTVSSGKVILLEDGIYYENIIWPSTDRIVLSSLNGPENCIIDGSNANESVIYLGNGNSFGGIYDPNATFLGAAIQKIQIRNGYGTIPVFHNSIRFGGGILIDEYMKVVVSNCVIKNNGIPGNYEYSGGVFLSFGSEGYLFGNTISDNNGPGIWWRSRHDNFDDWSLAPADWPYGVQGCAVNNIISNNYKGIYIQNGITPNSMQIRYNNSFENGDIKGGFIDAANYTNWITGYDDNEGFAFSEWTINTGIGTSASILNPSDGGLDNSNIGSESFSLISNSNESSESIVRWLDGNGIPIGESFSFYWGFYLNSNGGSKGFELIDHNTPYNSLFTVENNGFDDNIYVNGNIADSQIGTTPMLVTFTRVGLWEWDFSMTSRSGGTTYNETWQITNQTSPFGIRFYNSNQNDSNILRNLYFNKLNISDNIDENINNYYAGGSSYIEEGINGNISEDPLFTDPAINDYSLQLASPSIGSGQYGNDMGYQGSFDLFNDPITYEWSNGETSESFTYFPQTSQDLILTMSQGNNTCLDTISIEVIHSEVPVFEYVDDLYAGEYYDLPDTSLNNISGSWYPSFVDTNVTSIYTFYPDGSIPCVPTFEMTINIKPTTTLYVNAFLDEIQNCQLDASEERLSGITFELDGFNTVFQTTNDGIILLDSISDGIYNISIDTANLNWQSQCGFTQSFEISNGIMLDTINFGIYSDDCTEPNVTIVAPTLRRCFSNQMVYVSVSNANTAALPIENSFVDVSLNSYMNVTGSSLPYTSLGNYVYRFEIDTLQPGETLDFNIATYIPCSAQWNSTLCMTAELTPYGICVLDTVPSEPLVYNPQEVTLNGLPQPCELPWDQSSLSVEGWCQGDSVYFSVTNTGDPGGGDMECYSPVWTTIDGVVNYTDSLQINGGETVIYSFPGTGQTYILNASQHPLHPGNSAPNAHVELCGDTLNWTPGIITQFPMDDSDPVIDTYCGIVTGSYDPNDKQGFPVGVSAQNYIQPNQELEYLIRFQNTGNDTAFTVIIRDTLELDLNLFTVTSGVSSHPYTFKMYGPRVLEWTFNNILLPDSTTDLEGSNGFVIFQVDQVPDLEPGTVIENDADIYFDFNDPITTNTTIHRIFEGFFEVADPPTVSMENITTKQILNLYPNPTTNLITIQSESLMNNKFKIYDQQGREVMNGKLTGKNTEVSLDKLSRGTYTIQVDGNYKPAVIIKQ